MVYNDPKRKPKQPEKEDKGVTVNVVIDNKEVLSELKKREERDSARHKMLVGLLEDIQTKHGRILATLERIESFLDGGIWPDDAKRLIKQARAINRKYRR